MLVSYLVVWLTINDHTYLEIGLNSRSKLSSRLGWIFLNLIIISFLTPMPNSKSKGERIKLMATAAVAEVEKLKALKLTVSNMINKITLSSTFSKSFLYGWIQM